MHRFWFFPLVTGVCGLLYAAVCDWEGWQSYYFCQSTPMPTWVWAELSSILEISAPWGLLVGICAGLGTAWSELLRYGGQDKSGLASASRLCRNAFWIGLYALLANATTVGVVIAALKSGVLPMTVFGYWFPANFFLPFGAVNLAAILWMLIRTASTDDVLTPARLLHKLRRSTTVTG